MDLVSLCLDRPIRGEESKSFSFLFFLLLASLRERLRRAPRFARQGATVLSKHHDCRCTDNGCSQVRMQLNGEEGTVFPLN